MSAPVAAFDGRALGTSLRLVVTRPSGLAVALAAVRCVLAEVDVACSRFRQDSELSRLTRSGSRSATVSPTLAAAIEGGLRGARLSAGAVDPTVGTAMRTIGYDRDFDAVAGEGPPIRLLAQAVPGWRAVDFDSHTRQLRLPRGVEIDLGATAKGLAADRAAQRAQEAAGGGVLVGLGGDIAVAGEPPAGGWQIQVGEDSDAPLVAGAEAIRINSGAVATSSKTQRRWRRGLVELHHIVDPATGLPADGAWRTATVAAATCVDANIAATAAIVRGAASGAWLSSLHLPARLVDAAGNVARVAGWPRFEAHAGRSTARVSPA